MKNMTKSYFLLYQRAKKLFDEGKVKLENIKEEKEITKYYFTSNGHNPVLEVSKVPNSRLWLRHWKCDCQHYSLWQDKAECKHIKSCEFYLCMGGLKNG